MSQFSKGGNKAWYHREEGLNSGYFHTYDCLRVTSDDCGRKVHIWLPQEYEESQSSYPTLYFHDGNTTFWAHGASPHSWAVHWTLDRLQQSGQAKKVIVVAVYPVDRNREYTHDYWCPGMDYGGAPEYANYLVNKLKVWIDSNYRTLSDQPNTFLLGSSHGGLASFITTALHPHTYNVTGCYSSSFWASMGFNSLDNSSLLQLTSSGLKQKPKLYLTYGLVRSGGLHNLIIEQLATSRTIEMITLLKSKFGYDETNLFVLAVEDGKHEEISWQHQFELFAKQFLK